MKAGLQVGWPALLLAAMACPAQAQTFDMDAVQRQDGRLAAVAFRLFEANADRCPATRMVPGWALHSLAQYPVAQRADAAQVLHLDPRSPGVLAVVEAGPAAQAGVRPGDAVAAVDDQDLADPSIDPDGPASYAPLRRQSAMLDAAFAAGPARLRLRRDGADRLVEVRGVKACAVEPQITLSRTLSAQADEANMLVSLALAEYAVRDDELAFVVAHELAHVILGHKAQRAQGGASDPDPQLRNERDADRLAMDLLDQAGYAVRPAADFWARLGRDHPETQTPQAGHPSAGDRYAALSAIADEIEQRKRDR